MKNLFITLLVCFGLLLGGVAISSDNAAYACGDKDKSSEGSGSGAQGEST